MLDPKNSFQDLILTLQNFWASKGCAILQPIDTEVGAGTSHPATTLRALGPKKHWNVAYVQPCRRPTDGRYGENPNRVQHYYQFQVLMKPAPKNSQDLCLESFKAIGIDFKKHDIRFVEDDWENPTLGASGLGWEVWCDGMEVLQYTYFQQVGGIQCDPVPVELTYGLERIALFLQGKESIFDLNWNGKEGDEKITYGDVFFQNEQQQSAVNFEESDVDFLIYSFQQASKQCHHLLEKGLMLPAYESALKANHAFNMLDARGVISVNERASYISKIRAMAKECCEQWVASHK